MQGGKESEDEEGWGFVVWLVFLLTNCHGLILDMNRRENDVDILQQLSWFWSSQDVPCPR